jgi:hypothetical protein
MYPTYPLSEEPTISKKEYNKKVKTEDLQIRGSRMSEHQGNSEDWIPRQSLLSCPIHTEESSLKTQKNC